MLLAQDQTERIARSTMGFSRSLGKFSQENYPYLERNKYRSRAETRSEKTLSRAFGRKHPGDELSRSKKDRPGQGGPPSQSRLSNRALDIPGDIALNIRPLYPAHQRTRF